MNNAIFQSESDGVVFEIDPSALLVFHKLEIREIRPALLVKSNPNLGAVDVRRVYIDIPAQLPRVKILDGEPEVGVTNKEKLLAGLAVVECAVFYFKLERTYPKPKNIGVEDDSDLGHPGDELSFYVIVENAVAIENNREY